MKETIAEEVGTNMRIAQRCGFWAAIEAGKSYEDAEVETFDALRASAQGLAEALRKIASGGCLQAFGSGRTCITERIGTLHRCFTCQARAALDEAQKGGPRG